MFRKALTLLLLTLTLGVLFAQDAPKITAKVVSDTVYSGGAGKIAIRYEVPKGYHMFRQEDYVYANPDPLTGFTFGKTRYPGGKSDAEGNVFYQGTVTITKPFAVNASVKPGSYTASLAVGFQICSDANGTCLPPDEIALKVPLKVQERPASAPATTAAADSILADSTLAAAPVDSTASEPTPHNPMDILKYMIMAFLGGIILNVMPCVLPVLSIKAMHLVSQSQQNRRHIAVGSMVYALGVLLSFMVLAAVVAVLKTTGESAGWGFQMQNLGFTLTLTVVMFVFGLSMFDVFIINAPGSSLVTEATYKEGHWGSFFGGVFAVLLATPCTAPMLGPALGVAFKLPVGWIFAFFALIAAGLALPFVLIGFFPGMIKRMPKPGEWMNIFKEVMGFLLLGTVVFLMNTVYALLNNRLHFMKVLWFVLLCGFAAWLYGRFSKPQYSRRQQWIALILAVAIVVGSAFALLRFPKEKGWQEFSPQLVEQLQKEGKPVFIDFTAQWCMTCKANESGVLNTTEIQAEFAKHQVELIRGDYTRKDPVIFEWLQRYHRAGVPLYVLFDPARPEPVVFPEIITKPMVMDELKKLK
jgi:thiol:disulfide interchange protein DsbD